MLNRIAGFATRFAAATLLATVTVVGCSESSVTTTAVEAPAKPFNEKALPVVAFEVPGMMCEDSCAKTVQRVLADMPGAADVKVDFEAKKAEVAVEGEQFDAEKAVATLLDYGFDKTKVAGAPGEASKETIEATP